jgi:hypothetical protein
MNTNVTNQKNSYTELGMIFGMFIVSGIGSSLDKRKMKRLEMTIR